MRLIHSFENPEKGLRFSNFLKSKNIDTEADVATNKDWGSERYGTIECHVWILKEDQLSKAMEWLQQFQEDPENPQFDTERPRSPLGHAFSSGPAQSLRETAGPPKKETMGTLTFYILILCTLLFIATQLTTPDITEIPKNIPYPPLISSPIEKKLEYDYPRAYEIIDQIVALYGISALIDPSELPKEGRFLLKKYIQTPYWQGFYEKIVNHLLEKKENVWHFDAPLFEKIREGEIWRVITPCFLHANILHILFNMMWLLVLGQQIEAKIGPMRYILLILLSGMFSNTAQYLMSGSNFIGFSGVICAMIVFIWARQRTAAWEGYQLERSTVLFVAVFVLGMFAIQATSFFMEINGVAPLSAGIANTAHLAGALAGYLMAQTKFFAWR